MPLRRTSSLAAILALVALLATIAVSGCGDDGDDESAVGRSEETPPAGSPGSTSASKPEADEEPPVGDGHGGVALEEIGSFDQPVHIASPPDSGSDIYVVEQGGRIARVSPGGETSTFLDISDEVTAGGEQGLLSLAFAPDFKASGLLYVNYTDTDGNTRIVEYRSTDGREVNEDSRRELLRIEQPFSNHNGGLVVFGPDDLLYIGTGDGGSGGDPARNGQDTGTLLGKILRIDPSGGGSREPYGIPDGNPFANGGGRGEIFATGLRNPWRFSFDPKGGALAIGDVGQSAFEEVTIVGRKRSAGANFGWSAFEGEERFNQDQSAPKQVAPSLAYPTADGSCSVTGGYIVRDRRLRSLYGRYLYGDFCKGELRSFIGEPGSARDDRALGIDAVENLSSFGADRRGRIYASTLTGPVYRLNPR